MDSRHMEILKALDRLQKGTMAFQEAADIVDRGIESATGEGIERCVKLLIAQANHRKRLALDATSLGDDWKPTAQHHQACEMECRRMAQMISSARASNQVQDGPK